MEHMIDLLMAYGQGGPCELEGDWTYHNSFLVADAQEAWVLETAGRWWAAEQLQTGALTAGNKGWFKHSMEV
jgi:secernin